MTPEKRDVLNDYLKRWDSNPVLSVYFVELLIEEREELLKACSPRSEGYQPVSEIPLKAENLKPPKEGSGIEPPWQPSAELHPALAEKKVSGTCQKCGHPILIPESAYGPTAVCQRCLYNTLQKLETELWQTRNMLYNWQITLEAAGASVRPLAEKPA